MPLLPPRTRRTFFPPPSPSYKYGRSYQYVYTHRSSAHIGKTVSRYSSYTLVAQQKEIELCMNNAPAGRPSVGWLFFSFGAMSFHLSYLFSDRQSPMREPPLAAVRMDSTASRGAIANLDEARQMIAKLTERNNAQGHLLQAWKQRLKQQVQLLFRYPK